MKNDNTAAAIIVRSMVIKAWARPKGKGPRIIDIALAIYQKQCFRNEKFMQSKVV